METAAIGKDLVDLCRAGRGREAIDKHYSDDIVSIEGAANPEVPQRIEGIQAVREKNEWWDANHEIHEMTADGPFCAEGDDRFVVHFAIDVTQKTTGRRIQMSEVGIYRIAGGKIVEERFLYHTGN